jgi:hypothetical protein
MPVKVVENRRLADVANLSDKISDQSASGGMRSRSVDDSPFLMDQQQRLRGMFGNSVLAVGQLKAAPVAHAAIVQRFSLLATVRWPGYLASLPNNPEACDAIDTNEARTTLELLRDGHGNITNRIIRLHTYTNGAWGELGSVTMDRFLVPFFGPLPHGVVAPPPRYDDSDLMLHTAAAGGAGNAGVATHLFPAVLGWIDRNLRGVQNIHMNPAGGAASKAVIAELGTRLGDPTDHANADTARRSRKTTENTARAAAAAGGPAFVPIGSTAGAAGPLNTWDHRLNDEHMFDLASVANSPFAGLEVNADAMPLAGAAPTANDILTMRQHRTNFAAAMAGGAHPIINAAHPAAVDFQVAAGLTDAVIDASPLVAARILRRALLSSRSGPAGTGGAGDPGYQITLGGAALSHVLPRATMP